MIDVNLALPYFGLIFIGFACDKLKVIPDTALPYTWVEQASSAVLIRTLVSVFTLTTVMWMVKSYTLPALLFG